MQDPVNNEVFGKEVGFGATNLHVGIVSATGATTVDWAVNLAAQSFPMNMARDYCVAKGREVGLARNVLVKHSLLNAKYLWFIDDDVFPPKYACQRLWHAMQKRPDVMICAGIYYSKGDTPTPVVFEDNGSGPFLNFEPGDVFEVPGFIGTGCMLIRTEVFSKIEEPWFQTLHFPDHVTDDAYFCRKVRAAGFKILAHAGVLCGHYDARSGKTVWPDETSSTKSRILPDSRPVRATDIVVP